MLKLMYAFVLVLLVGCSEKKEIETNITQDGKNENAVCTFMLKNEDWNRGVTVEVKLGNSNACANNTDYGRKLLQKGETWSVSTNQDLCWRRDTDPDSPNGNMNTWTREACVTGGGKPVRIR